MNKLIILTLVLILSSVGLFSQTFDKIAIQKQSSEASFVLNKEKYKAYFGITNESRRPKITFNGKTNFTYSSIFPDAKLDFEIFSNSKLNFAYLIINNYLDITLGAEVYLIDNNYQFIFLGHLPVGAYNSIGDKKMNYNSILSYLSIFYTKEKTYFSFEVPLVVLNPGEITEQIVESKKIHYTLVDRKLKRNITE
ncbi:MAG: hypothetical protein WCR29_01420 [Bacteroidales bacterium]|nr:hypothetical protein [Bacteroidales bacterium]